MTSWDRFVQLVRQRFPIDDERDGYVQLVLDVGSGRSQAVVLQRAVLLRGREEWVQIDSVVGPAAKVDVGVALRRAGAMVCGGFVIVDDELVLRHAIPLENLDPNEFERPLLLVMHTADRLEHELLGDDLH